MFIISYELITAITFLEQDMRHFAKIGGQQAGEGVAYQVADQA